MSTPAPVLRPLSVGEILDTGFVLYRRHFRRLLGVMLGAYAPVIAFSLVHDVLGMIAGFLGQVAAQIGIIWVVAEVYLGQRPREQGVLGVVARQIVPVLGLQVVVVLMILLGMLALVVPGVLLALLTFAVTQVAVVEGDVGAALRRSWHLAQGAMGRVALVMLVVALLNAVVGLALQLGLNDWDLQRLAQAGFHPPTPGEMALSLAVNAVVAPYGTVVLTLLYFDQRVRKDGLDVELLARAAGP